MTVSFEREWMVVRFGFLDKIVAVRWSDLRIPWTSVRRVERSVPPPTLRRVRAPGTYVPGLIKAGSYYTGRGREFWFMTRGGRTHPITVTLTGSPYKRVVLGFGTGETPAQIETWWRRSAPSTGGTKATPGSW
jgi:hypothetical protein